MRCEEKSGFLMLHRCDSPAETTCVFCGKPICSQHTCALTADQLAELGPSSTMGTPVACLECFKSHKGIIGPNQNQNPNDPNAQYGGYGGYGRPYYRDPYYSYPYYGGYHPYYWGDYSDRDRRSFDSQQGAAGQQQNAQDS